MIDGHELQVEGTVVDALVLADHPERGADAVLTQLGLNEGQGEVASHQRNVVTQAQQVGHASDVVLVPVGEDQGHDVIQTVLDGGEVGEDEIDARLVLLGEEDTAVDDEELAVNLEHGHVAPDLAETTQGRDAHRAVGDGTGGLERRKVRHVKQCSQRR